MGEIGIVKITEQHVDQVVSLFDKYRQFYGQKSEIDGARAFLLERLRNDESVIFMASVDGDNAGFVQLYPIFSSVSMHRAWLLNDLYVDSHFRGRGIGGALLRQAYDFGNLHQSKWLLLQTASDNFPAQRLYERQGWKRETDLFYRFDLR